MTEALARTGDSADDRPRVLHLVGSLGIGGIEVWLMHMFRHNDEFSVRHEVLLTKADPGPYEEEARRLGVVIHRLPLTGGKLGSIGWLRRFRRFLRREGPYEIVHSHLSLFSGLILGAAQRARVPVRIAHCHNARSKGANFQKLRHKALRASMIATLRITATDRLGISDAAIEEIAGCGWRNDVGARVLLYGFDFSRAKGAAERGRALRAQLGIAPDDLVIGHVGRFDPVKNHELLLQSLVHLRSRRENTQLVMVGDGPAWEAVRARAARLGLAERVHLPGATDDVPAFMAMFDLLALPSFSEGLGIVVLEAQAVGTRALVSEVVPLETAIVPTGVEHLALSVGSDGWAQAMERIATLPRGDSDAWLAKVETSRFGIGRCVEELDDIYRTALERTR